MSMERFQECISIVSEEQCEGGKKDTVDAPSVSTAYM
jgi:hypothetical protein